MPKTILPIANGFYVSDSLPISAQECINWYPNIVQAQALNSETLFGTPGLRQVATTGEVLNVNRGAHVMNEIPYFVNGTVLYSLDRTVSSDGVSTYSTTSIGTIEGTAPVSMADNGTQLMILVPGGKGYIYNHVTPEFVEITDEDFTANGQPQYVVFIDGYFCCTTDSKKFIVSSLNDGTNWNALDFGSAEADPDKIVAPIVFKNQLFIAGSETFEAFQNIGGADFPFQRNGLFLAKGCYAPLSLVQGQDTFLWIGGGANESPAIWAFAGNSTQKVSTTAIDSILQREPNIQNAFAWSYAQKGAYFVGFTLSETTLVYDMISQRWHERRSTSTDQRLTRYRANSIVQAYGAIFVGDFTDGRIGELDIDLYTEYENQIFRRVSTQPFQANMDSFRINSIELTTESGVGDLVTTDPVIEMDISRDGGKTWNDKKTRPIGKQGEYFRRAIWRRNGRIPRFAVLRFTLTDSIKPVIIQLTVDIEK